MDYNLLVFSLEFFFFYFIYSLIINSKFIQKFVINFRWFKLIIFVIFLIQFIALFLIKFNVTDVFLFSDAGKNLLERIDIYWIDVDHGKYPFFPFLIFLYAGLVFLWQALPVLSFNFYLKVVLLFFLYFLGFLIYKHKKNQVLNLVNVNKSNVVIANAKLNLVAFLLSPITYAIVLYHGQIDIILIVFLYLALYYFQLKKSNFLFDKFYFKLNNFFQLIFSAILFAVSIASKTWSIIMLPIFALSILKSISIKRIFWFFSFVLVVIGLLLVNIKFYTLSVFGSSTQVVLGALTKPGGPTGIWGLGLIARIFSKEEFWLMFKLPVLGLGIFWSYIYYQVYFVKKNFNKFMLALMAILVFYLFAPRWGVQYIFWHWPFLLLFIDIKMLKNWVYQLIMPMYLFMNYFLITAQREVFPAWIVWGLGLAIYIFWLKWILEFLKNKNIFKT